MKKIKIVFSNNVPENLNKRWIRIVLLIFGLIFTLKALTEIFCLIVKPKGYEKIVDMLGNKYIEQLIIGVLALSCYYLFKKQKA